jgi:hypothetical protein
MAEASPMGKLIPLTLEIRSDNPLSDLATLAEYKKQL